MVDQGLENQVDLLKLLFSQESPARQSQRTHILQADHQQLLGPLPRYPYAQLMNLPKTSGPYLPQTCSQTRQVVKTASLALEKIPTPKSPIAVLRQATTLTIRSVSSSITEQIQLQVSMRQVYRQLKKTTKKVALILNVKLSPDTAFDKAEFSKALFAISELLKYPSPEILTAAQDQLLQIYLIFMQGRQQPHQHLLHSITKFKKSLVMKLGMAKTIARREPTQTVPRWYRKSLLALTSRLIENRNQSSEKYHQTAAPMIRKSPKSMRMKIVQKRYTTFTMSIHFTNTECQGQKKGHFPLSDIQSPTEQMQNQRPSQNKKKIRMPKNWIRGTIAQLFTSFRNYIDTSVSPSIRFIFYLFWIMNRIDRAAAAISNPAKTQLPAPDSSIAIVESLMQGAALRRMIEQKMQMNRKPSKEMKMMPLRNHLTRKISRMHKKKAIAMAQRMTVFEMNNPFQRSSRIGSIFPANLLSSGRQR